MNSKIRVEPTYLKDETVYPGFQFEFIILTRFLYKEFKPT